MPLTTYVRVLLDLAETLHGWIATLAPLDRARRRRVARYSTRIAETLARATEALQALEADPGDHHAARRVSREFGRIAGYVETIVGVLEHHLDGRKLAGVKRRLERLDTCAPRGACVQSVSDQRIDRLTTAEGYFRALADGLET